MYDCHKVCLKPDLPNAFGRLIIDVSADEYYVIISDMQAIVGRNPNFIVDLRSEENGPDLSKLFDPRLTKEIAQRLPQGNLNPTL